MGAAHQQVGTEIPKLGARSDSERETTRAVTLASAGL